MSQPKPFAISKRSVWEAYKRVKANRGAAGVDGQTITEFESDLSGNLYKLWNRLASGSYMPPAVRRVEIPKASGGTRPLGIPTVADRIAQMVVKDALEPILEPCFHADSYGYRPRKSAHDALAAARQRCWSTDWVLDVDIKGFFDNIDHALMMKAVRKHTDCRWVVLYIERWLQPPNLSLKSFVLDRAQTNAHSVGQLSVSTSGSGILSAEGQGLRLERSNLLQWVNNLLGQFQITGTATFGAPALQCLWTDVPHFSKFSFG